MSRYHASEVARPPNCGAARPWQDVVREVIDILSQTRHTFRSKQIERARKLLTTLVDSPLRGGDEGKEEEDGQ